jgi:hypothetical protein
MKRFVLLLVFCLGLAIVVLAATYPQRHVDIDLIKPGMAVEEIERIIPKQRTLHVGGCYGYTAWYQESGIAVGYLMNKDRTHAVATSVEIAKVEPRSYLDIILGW